MSSASVSHDLLGVVPLAHSGRGKAIRFSVGAVPNVYEAAHR